MAHPRSPILIFGGAGYLGRALVAHLADRAEAFAPPRSDVDVRAEEAVRRAVERTKPRAVVNLAAAQPGADGQETNDEGAGHVAAAAAAVGARLVHLSTDMVLDGRSPPYGDDAPAQPLNSYGRAKAAGERAVLRSGADAVIVRTSLIWDPHEQDRSVTTFAERLSDRRPVHLFTDEVRCPVTRATLVQAIERLLALDVSGTLNVAGCEALTRHDFVTLQLEYFGVPGRGAVLPARSADLALPQDEQRPRDLTLDVARAVALLDMPLPGVREELRAASR